MICVNHKLTYMLLEQQVSRTIYTVSNALKAVPNLLCSKMLLKQSKAFQNSLKAFRTL